MNISPRVKKLRDQSLNAVEKINAERALLMTQFYKSDEARELSAPVKRAKAFEYLLKNKKICINEGELIVGERGPSPKETPTYPEISLHSMNDLEILNSREKVSFRVDDEVKNIYEKEIIPFWKGKSNRDKIMSLMSTQWLDSYDSGVFTEFQEQRSPGHTVLGYRMFKTGFRAVKQEIMEAIKTLDFFTDNNAFERFEELKAMDIACDAIIMYANRHADKLEKLALDETYSERKSELLKMANVCRKVPADAPETVHEMLQQEELDMPSMRFTKNVMEEISRYQVAPATKNYINKNVIRGITSFFLVMIVGLVIYFVGQMHWNSSSTGNLVPAFSLEANKLNWGKMLNNTYVNIFIGVNTILGLILVDKYMQGRKKDGHPDRLTNGGKA